jgi:hypothetical protein
MEQNSDHKDFTFYLMKQHEAGNLMRDEIIINGALMMYVIEHWSFRRWISLNLSQQRWHRNHGGLSWRPFQSYSHQSLYSSPAYRRNPYLIRQ